MTFIKTHRASTIALAIITLLIAALAYYWRPLAIIHGPLWLIIKHPVWWVYTLPISLIAAAPFFLFGYPRYKRTRTAYEAEASKEDSSRSRYSYSYSSAPTPGFLAWGVGAFLVTGILVWACFFSWITPKWMAHETYKQYTYVQIKELPQAGEIRVVPKEVANGIANSGYQLSGHTLGDAHIVLDPRTRELTWTFSQEPSGVVNIYKHHMEGVAYLSAEHTERSFHEIDKQFKFGVGMKISDSLNWQFRKRHYFGVPTYPVSIVTKAGEPIIVMSWLAYKGWPVKYPALGGVMVFHADGRIEDLSPAEARQDPDVVATGRIIPEALARQMQDAYAYKLGVSNEMFTHKDQTTIQDNPDTDNQMPYLMAFKDAGPNGTEKLAWVSVAEPRGRSYAASAVFLTDAITGVTQVWRAGRDQALTGPNRAIQLAKQQPIAGIVYASTAEEQGKFQAVEPRPLFINGHLRYLVSIIGAYQPQQVAKSVIVDAEESKVLAVFNHDSDQQADDKLVAYLRTGELDPSVVVRPNQIGQGTGSTPTTPGQPTAPVSGDIGEILQNLSKSNAELAAKIKAQQAEIDALTRLLNAKEAKGKGK